MKKLLFKSLMIMGAMLAAVTGFTSCGGSSDDDPTPTLALSMSSINIDADGGSESVQVQSNTKWTISGGTNWCKVSPQSGDGNSYIDIEISENTATSSRSCTLHARTSDGSLSQDISVEQDGAKVSLSVDKSSISFTSAQGEKESLTITANMSWTISGIPDWLNASTTSGNGNSSITLTTKSANNTATERTATLTISSGTESVQVSISQEAGLSACKVTPEGLTTLARSFAFLPKVSGNVKRFIWKYITASDYNSWSESELLAVARQGTRQTDLNCLYSSRASSKLSPNTDYYLLTLAYDENDEEGELVKTHFKTKGSGDEQAYVAIDGDNMFWSTNYFYWNATPDGSTDKYYTMYISGLKDLGDLLYTDPDDSSESYLDDAKLIWILNNEISNSTGRYKVKKGEAQIIEEQGYSLTNNQLKESELCVNLGWAMCVVWGVNISDNKMSGYMSAYAKKVTFNSSSKKNVIAKLPSYTTKKMK